MQCPSCKEPIESDWLFCLHCGEIVDARPPFISGETAEEECLKELRAEVVADLVVFRTGCRRDCALGCRCLNIMPSQRFLEGAFVAFNAAHFADFVTEQEAEVKCEGGGVARVYHYGQPFSLPAQNRLFALKG